MFRFFYIYFLFSINLLANAQEGICELTAKKFTQYKNYSPTIYVMQKRLGKENSINMIRKIHYEWNDFYIITLNGKIKEFYGKIPAKLNTDKFTLKQMEIREIINKLGPPIKVVKDNLKKYIWQCNSTPSVVTITTNSQNDIMLYEGHYCYNSNSTLCSSYSYKRNLFKLH